MSQWAPRWSSHCNQTFHVRLGLNSTSFGWEVGLCFLSLVPRVLFVLDASERFRLLQFYRHRERIARKGSQLSMFREFSTVSLPEKEHELSLWGELKRICKGLHSELCAGQPLTTWNQLLCSKKARGSSQGSLTSPAGGLKFSAPWKSRQKGVGWAAASRNVPSEVILPHMPGLLLRTWSLRSFCLPVACGPSKVGEWICART